MPRAARQRETAAAAAITYTTTGRVVPTRVLRYVGLAVCGRVYIGISEARRWKTTITWRRLCRTGEELVNLHARSPIVCVKEQIGAP